MQIGGITRRWVINFLSVAVVVIMISVAALSGMANSYIRDNIRQSLKSRSDEMVNMFNNYNYSNTVEFYTAARNYIENFTDKELMEVMTVSRTGKVVVTSTGFEPDQTQPKPDFERAKEDSSGYGDWTGELTSGEQVTAISRVFYNEDGEMLGAIRYVVSMRSATRQMYQIMLMLILVGLFILVLLCISSVYFIRSILTPIRQISGTAKRIARGDFNVRIETKKKRSDEIGQLCDTINDMAMELSNSEQMKNDFISSVSHELRTPLTAIKGWAETLQSGEIDREMFSRGMGVIIHESERLSGLVEELLDFSRMQNGRMVFNMDKMDILAELGEAVYTFKERALREEKYLLYDEPENISPIRGDANRIRQVFVNIIDNALKYTQKGGTVRVTISQLYNNVHVVVSDNGCGIPAEHLPNVKRKFYKANQQVRGSGIGLAVADEIIKMHGGSLDVESVEGEGTAVTITLPIIPPEPGKTEV